MSSFQLNGVYDVTTRLADLLIVTGYATPVLPSDAADDFPLEPERSRKNDPQAT